MRRYIFYFAVGFIAFVISILACVFYTLWQADKSERAGLERIKAAELLQSQLKNEGFKEFLNSKNGDLITVQGFIDEKFLCLDVTVSQPNLCTLSLIGGSSENKSLGIHLKVCDEQNKSSCIVWKPDDRCAKLCADEIRIYDHNSKLLNLTKQNKFTGKVSIIEGNYFLKEAIEKIESADTQ